MSVVYLSAAIWRSSRRIGRYHGYLLIFGRHFAPARSGSRLQQQDELWALWWSTWLWNGLVWWGRNEKFQRPRPSSAATRWARSWWPWVTADKVVESVKSGHHIKLDGLPTCTEKTAGEAVWPRCLDCCPHFSFRRMGCRGRRHWRPKFALLPSQDSRRVDAWSPTVVWYYLYKLI